MTINDLQMNKKLTALKNARGEMFLKALIQAFETVYNKCKLYELEVQIETDRSILESIGQENIIYFIPKTSISSDGYDEYIYLNNSWEQIGHTDINLSNYYTKDEMETLLDECRYTSFFADFIICNKDGSGAISSISLANNSLEWYDFVRKIFMENNIIFYIRFPDAFIYQNKTINISCPSSPLIPLKSEPGQPTFTNIVNAYSINWGYTLDENENVDKIYKIFTAVQLIKVDDTSSPYIEDEGGYRKIVALSEIYSISVEEI